MAESKAYIESKYAPGTKPIKSDQLFKITCMNCGTTLDIDKYILIKDYLSEYKQALLPSNADVIVSEKFINEDGRYYKVRIKCKCCENEIVI